MKQNRDVSVELLRVVAALMVIGTHSKMAMEDLPMDIWRILFAGLVCDGVAIFWMVLGCFYFEGEYKTLLKRSAFRVLIPLAVFSILYFYLFEFLSGFKSFAGSVSHSLPEYKDALNQLLQWKNPVASAGHFWYLYVYMVVILLFPAFKGIRDYAMRHRYGDVILLIVLGLLLLANDLLRNGLLDLKSHAISGAVTAFPFVFAGDMIYRQRKTLQEKPMYGVFALVAGLVFIALRVVLLCLRVQGIDTRLDPLYWSTSFGYVGSILLFVVVLSLSKKVTKKEGVFASVIRHLGSRTFYIYIFHLLVLANPYICIPFRDWIRNRLGTTGFLGFLSQFLYMLYAFVVSLLISEIVFIIRTLIKKLICRPTKENEKNADFG